MKKIIIIALFLTLNNGFAFAQGGYAGAFLRMGVAARSEAMGRAYVAVAQGSEAAFFNAASTAFLPSPEINISFRSLGLDRSFTYLSFATYLHPRVDSASTAKPLNAGMALSWIHAGVDNIDARDSDGKNLPSLSTSEDAFALSFAIRPHQKFALGLTARYAFNRLPGVKLDNGAISATSLGFDFGALLEPISGIRLGAAVRDLNMKYTWNTQEVYPQGSQTTNRFPRGVTIGVAVDRIYPWLIIAADLEKRQFRDGVLHVGAQAAYREVVQVRAGLNDGQPTFGAGYRFELFGRNSELHYAFAALSDNLNSEHIFGWAFTF
jgi:hypothetical protein